MSKKCTIYYATVVDAPEESTWSIVGSVGIEPVRVIGEEPLGKDPEFCCKELAAAVNSGNITYYYRAGEETGLHISGAPGKILNFCPFCGAKIVFKEHLKLKVIAVPVTIHEHHYEVVG